MNTTHDDYPHPVPPIAYLRWKENWFFILIDPERDVHGIAHFNYEPGHDRARFTCNLTVRGKHYRYANQTGFPENFALAREIGDVRLRMIFKKPHAEFELKLQSDEVDLHVRFTSRAPTFDFTAVDRANPEKPSSRELLQFGANLPYTHQQQALHMEGLIELKAGNAVAEKLTLSGVGYRDHTQGMRTDHLINQHTWSFLLFPSQVFGLKKISTVLRPDLWAVAGYVHDESGSRALKDLSISYHGGSPGGLPHEVRFAMCDVYGNAYTATADITHRFGAVPLVSEMPGGARFYEITENFVPCSLDQAGTAGIGHVEIGFSRARTL